MTFQDGLCSGMIGREAACEAPAVVYSQPGLLLAMAAGLLVLFLIFEVIAYRFFKGHAVPKLWGHFALMSVHIVLAFIIVALALMQLAIALDLITVTKGVNYLRLESGNLRQGVVLQVVVSASTVLFAVSTVMLTYLFRQLPPYKDKPVHHVLAIVCSLLLFGTAAALLVPLSRTLLWWGQ